MKAFVGFVCIALFGFCLPSRKRALAQEASHEQASCAQGETLEARLRNVALASDASYSRRMLFGRVLALRVTRLCAALLAAKDRDVQDLSPGARSICESARLIQSAAATLRTARAPMLPACGRELRVERLARETLRMSGAALSEDIVRRALCAFEDARALSLRELSALPLAFERELMRMLLVLGESARTRTLTQRSARLLVKKFGDGSAEVFTRALRARRRSSAFYAHTARLLRQTENAQLLEALDRELERLSLRLDALLSGENDAMVVERSLLGHVISSLRVLERLDFAKITEECSSVSKLLCMDPSQVYARMDDASRALYRHEVARIASGVALSEVTVARQAVELCLSEDEGDAPARARDHVGYYLLGEGVYTLYERLGGMGLLTRVRYFCTRHAGASLLCARIALTALFTLCFLLLGLPPALSPLAALASSGASIALIARFVRAFFPRRPLPVLEFDALPESARTLVVVPALLSSREGTVQILRHMAVLARAGGDEQLEYLLLGDYRDSEAAQEIDDADIGRTALSGIEALNRDQPGRFYYLHRKRVWDDAHKRYMSPMRKRGALLCLCELIQTGRTGTQLSHISFDPLLFHHRYAQIITLDSDTLLPPGSAQKLIGALLHPLCNAAVIAPRMESAARLIGTHLADLLGGPGGVDVYQGGVSDLYQDLCGHGSFAGKGIIRVADYYEKTRDLPARYALSHDLLEGELIGSALMENTAFYDGPCARVQPFFMQLHRWTRGDWQLLPFLFSRVPSAKGESFANPLSLLSRVKIYDNLRRSLVAPAQLALFFACALTGSGAACLLALFLPHLGALLWPSRRALMDALFRTLLAPRFALCSADAIIRALYRQFVSGAHLLNWVTASDAQKKRGDESGDALYIWCAAALFALSLPALHALFVTLPLSGAFLCAPRLTRYLNAPLDERRPLSEEERKRLLHYARLTFDFFERVVTPREHFLPPDNLQVDPARGVASRTSPTNIGLYLLSCVSARLLGLLEPDEMARRIGKTLATLERLPKWRGHLYNWYDTRTLAPLPPAYVSSVDSGNFLACLIACAQALRADEALIDPGDRTLASRLLTLLWQTDIPALYDPDCDLFFIGAQIGPDGKAQLPDAHYDLLASESRLLSYVAVATRAVPARHWQRLSRLMAATRFGPALASWSGTMFEYMMPRLLQRDVPGTLLSGSCQHAVLTQMTLPNLSPWGVSESGCYRFDRDMNYQYHAFGVAQLSLRTERFLPVTAPYAAALALPCFAHAAVKNLAHFEAVGMLGELGFYEAADYTVPGDTQPFSPVKSHMAHHQGMLLCALCNALTGNALVGLFHQNPQMEAFSLMLEERMPKTHGLPLRAHRSDEQGVRSAGGAPIARRVKSGVLPVQVHLLRGGGTTLLCDARGGGFLRAGGLDLTRSRYDPLHPSLGLRFYLRVGESPDVHQACEPAQEEEAVETVFEAGCARYVRTLGPVKSELAACVDPLSGAALHRLTLTNTAQSEIDVRVASFMEVSLSAPDADAAHRAFSSLFVRTHRLGAHAVAAKRRPRTPQEESPLLVHALFGDVPEEVHALTDRAAFFGDALCAGAPQALFAAPKDRVGDVIDPCLSLMLSLSIAPGAQQTICFLTAPAPDDEQARALLGLYPDADALRQALTLSSMHQQVTADALGLTPQAMSTVERACAFLVYPAQNPARRKALLDNTLPYETLYSLSLSGDLPILCVRAQEEKHLTLCREALHLHEYYTLQGLLCDLVFVVPGGGDYQQPVRDAVRAMIHSGYARERSGQRGGVHLLSAQEVGEEKLLLLQACAALTLTGGEGSLAAQIKPLLAPRPLPPAACPHPAQPHPLPKGALTKNGYGAFMPDGAYAIDRSHLPPAPWCNVLANEHFGALVSESGPCCTWALSSHDGRLTPWTNDPVLGRCTEALLLYQGGQDTAQDLYAQAHTALHEPGVTHYLFEDASVRARVSLFVPPTGAMPPQIVRYARITLENRLSDVLSLRLCARVPFWLDTSERAQAFAYATPLNDCVQVQSPHMPGAAFLTFADAQAAGYGVDALYHTGEAQCALSLDARKKAVVTLCLGYCKRVEDVPAAVRALRLQGDTALEQTQTHWQRTLGRLTAHTGDACTDMLLNTWLPYQVRASRLFARAGFYQAGGAIGFRDQLQDTLSMLLTEPEAVREHLLLCAAHQFEAGDVQHWWHPPARGVRTRMSDDLLFLPFVCACYIRATGDEAVLNACAPFLHNIDIPEDREDVYTAATFTHETYPLREHCLRAIDRVRFGRRGLPLIGTGDWNDAMNRVGHGGEGESVWLGFFLVCTARLFASVCPERAQDLHALAQRVMSACEKEGWDGAWYRRAFMDDGTPLGSAQGDVCRIDCIAQCWAVLAGAEPERAGKAMDAVMEQLWDAEHGILRLLTPPFDDTDLEPGYIKGYLPGVRENGGQYTHGACWAVLALCRLGRADEAWLVFRALLPSNHARTPEEAAHYRTEPYVVAADVYGAGENTGRGGWTWYTGSASWLLIAAFHALLGLTKHGERLRLSPLLAQDMTRVRITYRYGDALYHLTAARDIEKTRLDGEVQPNGFIPLSSAPGEHEAGFPVANESKQPW